MDKYIVFNNYLIDFDNHEIQNMKNGNKKSLGGLNEELLKMLIHNPKTTLEYDSIINHICPMNESKDDKRSIYDAKDELKNVIIAIDDNIDFNKWVKTVRDKGYRFIAEFERVKSDYRDIEAEVTLFTLYTLLYGECTDKEILFSGLSTIVDYKRDISPTCFAQSYHDKLTMLEFLERVLPEEALSYINSLNSKQRDQLSEGLIPSNIQQNIYSDIRYNELWLRELLKKCKLETENNLFNIEIGMSSLISIVNNDGRSRRLFDCYHRCTDGRFYYRGLAVLLVYSLIGRNRFAQLVSQDTDYRLFIE